MFKLYVVAAFCLVATLSFALGDLPSADVAQTPCINPRTTTTWETLWFFGNPVNPYFVSMGSQHLYRSYAEVFLGRPVADQEELNAMNLKILFEATYTVLTMGYNKTLIQQCLPKTVLDLYSGVPGIVNLLQDVLSLRLTGLTQGNCVPLLNLTLNTSSIASSYDQIVWSNQTEGAVLITRCVNKKVADWKVLSTNPTLSAAATQAVLETVNSLGLIL